MSRTGNWQRPLAIGVSVAAILAASSGLRAEDSGEHLASSRPASGPQSDRKLDEIIVTAERREESEQRVPIAVSAFTQATLEAQGIVGGPDLQLAIPNFTSSRDAYFSSNFQIRGIGTQVVNVTADPSTGIHVNESPLVVNNLFEGEFYDMERVEVLRGPQGTLYGRNATGGVVNIVTAKPGALFSGLAEVDAGNYESYKAKGYVNIPLAGDKLGLRLAGLVANRMGVALNEATHDKTDGRTYWSGRATLAFEPNDRFDSYLMWEHFNESDSRARYAKMLCTPDPGPAAVGGVTVDSLDRNFLSQGCKATSIYGGNVFGGPNTAATLPGIVALRAGIVGGDSNAGVVQSPDLRTLDMWRDPSYRAKSDLTELNLTFRLTESLKLISIGSYETNSVYSRTYSVLPTSGFLNTALTPGGLFTDPQIGTATVPLTFDIAKSRSHQAAEEVRVQSELFGPVNFSFGVNYLDFTTVADYFFLANEATAYAVALNHGVPCLQAASTNCVFIDPNAEPNGNGHNYFDNLTPYSLKSKAGFGEVYYNLTPKFKITAGTRYTQDSKSMINDPLVLLVASDAAQGRQPGIPATRQVDFGEVTGRLGFDWQVDLPFTDKSLLYGFYSRGYKGGGLNVNVPPGSVTSRPMFDPEFVNSIELGLKNTLLGNRLFLNLTGFYYDYKNYQITKIVNRASVTENVDAEVGGLELETTWKVTEALHVDATAGLLYTAIKTGSSIDTFNLTQGDPNLTLVKNTADFSNCVAPTSGVAQIQSQINAGALPQGSLSGICTGAFSALGVTPSDGVPVNLKGKELPNAPPWSLSMGAAYTWNLPARWKATLRGDFYARGRAYSRIYNSSADYIKGWTNTNALLAFTNDRWRTDITFYGRNIFDQQQVTDTSIADASLGLTRDVFLLDPREYGVTIAKRF